MVSGRASCEIVSSRQTLKLRPGSLTFAWKCAINFLGMRIVDEGQKLLELRPESVTELRKGGS